MRGMMHVQRSAQLSGEQVMAEEALPAYNRSLADFRRLEEIFRGVMSPDVPTYDVNCTQPANFTEYTYSEGFGCFIAQTQSIEINARLMCLAARHEPYGKPTPTEDLVERLTDKWQLQGLDPEIVSPSRVFFAPGGSALFILDVDKLQRKFDDSWWYLKPHPVTTEEDLQRLKFTVGSNRILDKDTSGMRFIQGAQTIGYTMASEMGIVGIMLKKHTEDFSLYRYGPWGRYHSIYNALYRHDALDVGGEVGISYLNKMIACPWSGIVPLNTPDSDAKTRFQAYREQAENIRLTHQPMVTVIAPIPNGNVSRETGQ